MPTKIFSFPYIAPPGALETSSIGRLGAEPLVTIPNGVQTQTDVVLSLSGTRGYYPERLKEGANHRRFFELLLQFRVLYIIQEKDGPILATDIVSVPEHDEKDNVMRQVHMSVGEFYWLTSEVIEETPNFEGHISLYAKEKKIMIEMEDEDADDFADIEQEHLVNERGFFPEAIPMSHLSDEDGYDYEIIDPLSELHVSATSFVRDEKYIPPLLYLAILAVRELDLLDVDQDEVQIQIARFGSGRQASRILIASYDEFIDWIDASLQRNQLINTKKYNTPRKRIEFFYERIVKDRLDPKNLGGGYIAKGED